MDQTQHKILIVAVGLVQSISIYTTKKLNDFERSGANPIQNVML